MHSMDLVCMIQDLRSGSGRSYKEIEEALGGQFEDDIEDDP